MTGIRRSWKERMPLAEGETCDLCRNFRLAGAVPGRGGPRKMMSPEYCLSCHDGTAAVRPGHHERAGDGGLACLSCHLASKTARGEASIHDHEYLPREALEKNDFIPSPDFRSICFVCHPAPGAEA